MLENDPAGLPGDDEETGSGKTIISQGPTSGKKFHYANLFL